MKTHNRRRTLWLTGAGFALIATCYGLARYAYGVFLPAFRNEFGLSATTAGGIASGSYLAYCIAIVLSSILTPRFGGRVVALGAGVIATLGMLLVAVAPNWVVLTLGILLAGSSTGVASPPLAYAVARTVKPAARDRVQMVINAGAGLGVAVAGPVAFLTQGQWRSAWLAFAVIGMGVTIWATVAIPSGSDTNARESPPNKSLPRPFFPSGSGSLAVGALLVGFSSSAVWTFGREVVSGAGSQGEISSTIAWVLLGVFGSLGAVAGEFTERFALRRVWAVTLLLMGAATVALPIFAELPVPAWISAAVFGATYITLTGLLLIWGTAVYRHTPAFGVGFAFLVLSLGQAAGAPVIGALSEVADPQVSFAVAAIVAFGCAFIRPRAHRA